MNFNWIARISVTALVGLFAIGVGCTSHPGKPNAEVVAEEPFGPEPARRALADAFALVRGEELAQLLRATPIELDDNDKDEFYLRGIRINLKNKTYYWPEVPRRTVGWAHSVEWNGKFERDTKGKWVATTPSEIHVWPDIHSDLGQQK